MSEQVHGPTASSTASDSAHGAKSALILGAIGVVFGDIGTSPLYTMHETFLPEHGLYPLPSTVLGILSLVTWSLIIVVAVKYVSLVMRADNKGEGGIMALMTLAQRAAGKSERARRIIMLMALLGAALFFGDGVITPSISVLSAIEGLNVAAPTLSHWVVPITVLVLLGLFWLQRRGSARVGSIFGPVMVVWFVTGAGALYADMGHFGRVPIRTAWFAFVLPALLLNYYGQGGLLLQNPRAIGNPFYHAVPDWALY